MKIINLITLKNLKLNKSRTIVTMIGILLSCALITVVANMAFSFQKTMLLEKELTSGNYIYCSQGQVARDEIKAIEANRNVEEVYVKKYIGFSEIEQARMKKYSRVLVSALNSSAFNNGFHMELAAGRFPQNSGEILLCNNMLNMTEKQYKVGEEITLSLGDCYQKVDGESSLMDLGESGGVDWEIKNKSVKKYKIVGLLAENHSQEIEARQYHGYGNAYTLYDQSDFSETEGKYSAVYARYKESQLENYKEITGQLLGVSPELVRKVLIEDKASKQERDEFNKKIKKNQFVQLNTGLVTRRGIDLNDASSRFVTGTVLILIFVIMFVSVFVIRNSFAISILEKTKLYGMMASVGATSKQIRNNVLFEGFVLGACVIPLGIGLGYGVTAGLIGILNLLIGEFLNGISIVFGSSIWAVVMAVFVSGITIFFSCVAAAVRASKISPIMAIRNSKDIKVDKKKKYKTPKYISKFFGIGGEIAYKNLKRSKKKYRTTVISIVVSVMLFISMAAFMEYTFNIVINEVGSGSSDYSIEAMTTEEQTVSSCMKKYKDIQKLGMHTGSYMECELPVQCDIDPKWTGGKAREDTFGVTVLDHDAFRNMVKESGMSYEQVKGKAVYFCDGYEIKEVSIPNNTVIHAYDTETDNAEKRKKLFSLTIAGEVKKLPDWMGNRNYLALYVEEGTVKDSPIMYASMNFKTGEADKLEEKILEKYELEMEVINLNKEIRVLKSIRMIVGIFVYGFIIVISLIGITNIFNTITTNMKLRQKEFAMLRSVGMTRKEFNKMIRLESIFYGTKALILGLPLGLAGNYLIYHTFRSYNEMINDHYVFPIMEVCGSILAVLLLIRVIMSFSVSKTKNQNIIETIRNDNI